MKEIETNAKVFVALAKNLYKNPFQSALREVIMNALDSGSVKPIQITIPTRDSSFITIQDFGVGMSEEFLVNTYTSFLSSTKESDSEATGSFGLGCKSPFAFTNKFEVISIKDGFKVEAVAYLDSNQMLKLVRQEAQPTSEINGTTIRIPFSSIALATSTIENICKTCNPDNFVINFNSDYTSTVKNIYGLNTCCHEALIETSKTEFKYNVVIGGIMYPIEIALLPKKVQETFSLFPLGFTWNLNKGDLEVLPSREGIFYNKKSIDAIVNLTKILVNSRLKEKDSLSDDPMREICPSILYLVNQSIYKKGKQNSSLDLYEMFEDDRKVLQPFFDKFLVFLDGLVSILSKKDSHFDFYFINWGPETSEIKSFSDLLPLISKIMGRSSIVELQDEFFPKMIPYLRPKTGKRAKQRAEYLYLKVDSNVIILPSSAVKLIRENIANLHAPIIEFPKEFIEFAKKAEEDSFKKKQTKSKKVSTTVESDTVESDTVEIIVGGHSKTIPTTELNSCENICCFKLCDTLDICNHSLELTLDNVKAISRLFPKLTFVQGKESTIEQMGVLEHLTNVAKGVTSDMVTTYFKLLSLAGRPYTSSSFVSFHLNLFSELKTLIEKSGENDELHKSVVASIDSVLESKEHLELAFSFGFLDGSSETHFENVEKDLKDSNPLLKVLSTDILRRARAESIILVIKLLDKPL